MTDLSKVIVIHFGFKTMQKCTLEIYYYSFSKLIALSNIPLWYKKIVQFGLVSHIELQNKFGFLFLSLTENAKVKQRCYVSTF